MNLVLIGYRGTGKSTVGQLAAARLGLTYVGFDAEIVRRAGKSIPEIVGETSWEHFRDLESEVVSDFSALDGQVLDTGGGVITRDSNIAMLRQGGLVFWLSAPVDEIVARIASSTDRPSLTGGKSFLEEVEEVLAVRIPLYRAAAHHTIETAGSSPEQVASRVVEIFLAHQRP